MGDLWALNSFLAKGIRRARDRPTVVKRPENVACYNGVMQTEDKHAGGKKKEIPKERPPFVIEPYYWRKPRCLAADIGTGNTQCISKFRF